MPEDQSQSAQLLSPRLLLLGGFAALAVTLAYVGSDFLSFEKLRDNRETLIAFRDANYLLSVLAFIVVYVVVTAFSLPGAVILTLSGGFLFGTFPGVFFNALGASLGAAGLFLAVRWGFGAQLSAKIDASEGMVNRIKCGIDENQWSMLFLIRLVPLVPFFVANLIPAFLGVPFRRFFVSTFLGILPGGLVYTSIGAGLGEVFARGETPNLSVLGEPYVYGPLIGLILLALLPMALKTYLPKKDT